MLISELEEMLKRAKDKLGDVEVLLWDSSNKKNIAKPITVVNYEGNHIELTD